MEVDFKSWVNLNPDPHVNYYGAQPKPIRIEASGTNVARYTTGVSTITKVTSIPYLELVERKHNGTSEDQRTLDYIPDVNFLKLWIDEEFAEEIEKDFGVDVLPNWAKVLKDVSRSQTFLKAFIKKLFVEPVLNDDMYLPNVINRMAESTLYPATSDSHGYMIFAGTSKKSELSKLAKLFKKVLGDEYLISELHGGTNDGDEGTTNFKAENKVKDLIRFYDPQIHKGFIVLSMGMGSRSFSVSQIDTVVFMKDGGDVVQQASRPLTGGNLLDGEVKKQAFVIHAGIDQNRGEDIIEQLIMQQVMKINEKQETESIEDTAKRVFKSLNIFEIDPEGYVIKIIPDNYWDEFANSTKVFDILKYTFDVNSVLADEEIRTAILGVATSNNQKKAKQKRSLGKGKTYINDETKEEAGDDVTDPKIKDEDIEQRKSEAREIIERIDTLNKAALFIHYLVNGVENSLLEAIKVIESDEILASEFCELVDISIGVYKSLIEKKILSANMLEIAYQQVK